MIRTLLVLALAGCVLAAGPPAPSTEQWKFVGKIMSGVANPRETFAGTNLDIDIEIQRQQDQSIEVKFARAISQDFNQQVYIGQPSEASVGDSQSSSKAGFVGEKKEVKALEGSFKAYLHKERGTVMEVPQGEQIWVTNVRKAIMNMMKVPPYTGDTEFVDLERNAFRQEHDSRASQERISYKRAEHIFAGLCNVSYTISRDPNNGRWPGSPDNVLPEQGEYFRMRRSVDFDSCFDVVNFQKASIGNFSQSYRGQQKEVSERSTYGEYLMQRRSDGSYQLKGILQTGDTIVRPFGQDSGRVVVHSNQTMSLLSVSRAARAAPRPSAASRQPVSTWYYQFTSPASADPQTKVDWVIYQNKPISEPVYPEYAVVGDSYFSQQTIMSQTQATLESITKLQQAQVADYQKPYNGTTDGHLAQQLKVLAQSIRALNKQNIQKLFKDTQGDNSPASRVKRQSFLDAVAASGSSIAIQELIAAAKAGQVPEIRMGGIMPLLTNSIIDPHAIKELMQYVVSINQESKYLDMMAHLNFAKLAQRVCFDEQRRNYSVPQAYLGSRRCDRAQIQSGFVDHLKQKIQSSQQTWRKLMYLQALGLLGLEDTIPYLANLATNQDPSSNPSLRMGAIHAISNNFNRGERREKVIRQLLPIVESHSEDFEIRESAFIAVMYMRPNATLLQRMAFQTYRDPSSQMKAVVASTFISLAQSVDPSYQDLSSMARKMLPMLQMSQPSLLNAFFFDYKERIPDYKIGVSMQFAWMSSHPSKLQAPRQALLDLKADFGGIVAPLIKVYAMVDADLAKSSIQFSRNARDAQQKKIHQELSELTTDLEIEQKQGNNDAAMYISAFNYEGFVAPSAQAIANFRQKAQSFLDEHANKPIAPFYPDQTVKFFNLVDILSILPTPFGTPAILEVSAPNNWLSLYDYVVRKGQSPGQYNVTVNGLNKMVMKTQSLMKVLMPWHNFTAVAGIDTEHSVNLPGQLSMLFGVGGAIAPRHLIKTTYSPVYQGELPLLYSRSKPLSALRSIYPSADLSSSSNIVSPASRPQDQYQRSFPVPVAYLGLKSRVTFQGDVEYPYIQKNIVALVQNPERVVSLLSTPTQKDYVLSYRLNIDQSETKNITLGALVWVKQQSLASHMPPTTSLEQAGQRIAQKLSIKDSLEQQLAEAERGEFGDFTVALAVNYTAPNVRTRQFELALSGSNVTKPSPSQYQQVVVFNVMSLGQPQKPQQQKLCFVTSIFEQLKPKQQNGNQPSELYTTAQLDVFAGRDCSQSEKVGQTDIRMYLANDDREPRHQRTLRGSLITGAQGRTPFISNAVYDKIDMQIKLLSPMPQFAQNITNQIQDLAYGALFPHVVRNRQVAGRGQSQTVIVNVTRNMVAATVDAWVHSPEEIALVEQVNVAPIFDWASPLLGPHEDYIHNQLEGRRSLQAVAGGSRCKIAPEQVATFDGVSFKKTPTKCWTVATQVQHQQDSFAVMFRQAESSPQSEEEVQVLVPGVAKIELLKGQLVKVNDQIVTGSKSLKDTSGKIVGSLNKTADQIIVSIPSKLEVVLKNKKELTITLVEKYRSFMNGMCGDFNGEQAADMRSPKGCIYTADKGPVFAASWVAKKNSCRDQVMQEALQQAMRGEQENCHKSLSSNSKRDHQQRFNRQQARRQ